MMLRWCGTLFFYSLLVSQLRFTQAVNTNICLPNIPLPQAKNFPTIPNTFEAVLAWNTMGDNATFYINELFSEPLNIGVMVVEDLLGPGLQSKLFTYGHTNEFVYIPEYDGSYGAACVSGDLAYNDFAFPFSRVSGHDKLVSGKDVLMMGANAAAMVYKGNDTINDIDVDVWNGCLYVADTDMTINATYYFTLNTTDGNTWRTASGLTTTIKRIHMIQADSKNKHRSESTHEYVYFSGSIPEMTPDNLKYLEPPLGAYCAGRKNNKPVPSVPNYFSFRAEVYDPKKDLVTYTDEWYDYTSNMSRIDHNEKQDRTAVSRPIKIIHDYETGLSYKIHMYTGDCNITKIAGDSYDNVILPGKNGNVRMRNPQEFFNFDNPKYPWIYEGTHVVRGVECEVWISQRPYPTEDSPFTGMWEWYFTSKEWKLSTGEVVETTEPFKMVVTVPKYDQKTEFNIYDFNESPPDERYFDVSECMDQHDDSRTYAYIMLADVKKYQLDLNPRMLVNWIAFSIETSTGIRTLRIHNIQVAFQETKVFIEFTLLGAPKNITGDVNYPLMTMSLDNAEKLLLDSVNNNSFHVEFMMQDGKIKQFPINKTTFSRLSKFGGDAVYYFIDKDGKPQEIKPDVGAGGIAGIVIAMLLLGAATVAVPFVVVTRRKKDLQSFNRSQLTMSDMADE